ncbi:MAG: hypothetical protein ACI8QC_001076 [Planctomycetota bacterium]|jgi:hypothetical protein
MSLRPLSFILSALLLQVFCSCGTKSRPVLLASSPPGARIVLDGRDSGFVTPASLDLSNQPDSCLVELVLPGYRPARRMLSSETETQFVFYDDWTVHYNTWRFPLWLNWEDLVTQVIRINGHQAARIFVHLRRS